MTTKVLLFTHGITTKRVTSGEAHLSPRLSAWAAQFCRSVAAMTSRWRHCVSDLAGPGIEPQAPGTDSNVFNTFNYIVRNLRVLQKNEHADRAILSMEHF